VANCIKFYATADEIGADVLKNHCSELISANWVRYWFRKSKRVRECLIYMLFSG
jgi:hypothetical protein